MVVQYGSDGQSAVAWCNCGSADFNLARDVMRVRLLHVVVLQWGLGEHDWAQESVLV